MNKEIKQNIFTTHSCQYEVTDYFQFRDGASGKDTQYIFLGSLNCLRHKPFADMGKIMQKGQGAILCPSMADFSTGRYLNQLKEAILELSNERNIKKFQLITGCQWIILSSDGDFIIDELQREHGITLQIYDENHLDKNKHDRERRD